ncbi:MAG: TonB-dependent receptor plug domain-containing protein, partial [Pontibacter sp.]|nr:TonB-dependent receptor plug domain-containing protein [Pontibacter sp.]
MKQTLHLAHSVRRYSCLTLGLCFFSFAASAQISSADTVATVSKAKSPVLSTGSQVTLKQEALNKGLLITPTQLLTGAVPGLLVRPVSGAPGTVNQLRIRQGSSFAGHVQPLVVLNGMPLHQQEMVGVSDPLSFLNPQDIASITVLKDAAATAMYGSRGSNGVILITTQPMDESIPEFNLSLSTTG